jgi:putative ABC transport system ATP-binding protein
MNRSFIQVENLTKAYPSGTETLKAVDGITLSIEQGETVTILGPSGSGKSTLMNLIGGIDKPDAGSIFIDDTDITTLNKAKLTAYRRNSIGFVFQFYNLIPDLNVYENVEAVADICKNPLDIDMLLDTLGLWGQGKKYPVELSGGQQQRVAIARAIVKNPKILLCDEPTGALDSKTSLDILKLMNDVHHMYGTTVLIITHNTAIAAVTHRTIRLKDGKIALNEVNKEILPVDSIVW